LSIRSIELAIILISVAYIQQWLAPL